ncbi:hypothetical protein DOTSEDRAFT_75704 [Dothistroma septosporum NZE10]|uniref:non-specific serine/threonine protein kinase n=1 Tax=Dothistroma septosporum (strain NZE10 / CBS 128990) TaxID=675120 RepID=N1PBF4_DOTSN|nr:hypothetical protein DOTSEDRAFT_75704 [Dothistroma septosporum NZE10]
MLLTLRLWLGCRIYGTVGDPRMPAGVRVGRKRMIKLNCKTPEVEALSYVAANTTFPCPKVHRIHRYRGKLAIELDFLPACRNLLNCWRQLSTDEQRGVVEDVSTFVQQLRALPFKDPHRISSTSGGPCRSVRISSSSLCGPFDHSAAFHECLRGGLTLEGNDSTFGDAVSRVHNRSYIVKFTHGDLAAQNILVRGGKVVAIVDWECAGWYPEYWEYTSAHYNYVLLPEFYDKLSAASDRYDEELKAERELWKILDQPLDQISG